jgi:hypothetical protein
MTANTLVHNVPESTFLPLVIVFLLTIQLYKTIKQKRRLAHIPGPTLAAYTNGWLLRATYRGDFYQTAEALLRKYGESEIQPMLHKDLTADFWDRFAGKNRTQHDPHRRS